MRQYKPDPVSDEDLNRIAEAGWRAPSAKNRQAWDFVIVTDKAQLQELSTVWQGAGHIAGAAAAIAFVIPEPPDERRRVTDQYDVGQATMAMMIAATDLGIGTGHSSVGDQDKARAILGVPEVTRWLICSVSGIPLTARSSRSASRIGGRSTRLSTTGIGDTQSLSLTALPAACRRRHPPMRAAMSWSLRLKATKSVARLAGRSYSASWAGGPGLWGLARVEAL